MQPRAGTTLIELVVAIAIASIVTTIGYAAFNAASTGGERLIRGEANLRGAATRRTILEWLGNATILPNDAGSFRGLDETVDGEDLDRVEFTTAAPTPAGIRNTLVLLYIDTDTTTGEKGLVAELHGEGSMKNVRVQLDSAVRSMDARYTSHLVTHRTWLPSWVSSTVLPDQIQLRLDGEGVNPLLRLPIVSSVGIPR